MRRLTAAAFTPRAVRRVSARVEAANPEYRYGCLATCPVRKSFCFLAKRWPRPEL